MKMKMTTTTYSAASAQLPADWRDFLALTKPRVMSLVVFTGLCGLLAAPVPIHPVLGFTAILCIALGAGAAGALNMWYEADLDALMKRTAGRPIPAGRMDRQSALHFGVGLAAFSVLLMGLAVNYLAAAILLASILFYVLVYTVWLKRRTPQNIVIGGAAGAFPALIGWAAATGRIDVMPVLRTDYASAGVPMLPVVAGNRVTRIQILLYTVAMAGAAIAPWFLGLTGAIYGVASLALNAIFLLLAIRVAASREGDQARMKPERQLFAFSILYLFLIFGAVVADRMLLG
jgi:protoheme IX farnesyltransferase